MRKQSTARAPINIALIKYWGKRDEQLVLPYNPSISLSLDVFETKTTMMDSPNEAFTFHLNGQPNEAMKQKVSRFLQHFTKGVYPTHLHVETFNSGPTAAGLASSASGFAALAVCANHYYQTGFTLEELASITRLG
ncbi:MAG: diphosphomevalonate decarboxylase, partial [Candidatus Izemoplasmatales bacterium]|nr:diphosphomevalonate decarboxylase [Candidatus Izemoplasmatales bacterium]